MTFLKIYAIIYIENEKGDKKSKMSNSTGFYYYYDNPTQVKYFYDGSYHGAIAFRDVLIDGRTGEVYELNELLKRICDTYQINADSALIEYDWYDLDEVIIYGKASD